MPTQRRKCSGPSRESLVMDLLLEIVARTDVTTLVRCAATSRALRRAILDPAFRRRLLVTHNGFDPALLLGVSYREHDHLRDVTTQRVLHSPAPTQLRARLDADSFRVPFKPVASSDGLLVLRFGDNFNGNAVELRACDAFTGHVTSLPPTTLPDVYLHHVVLLSLDHAVRSFELLVADRNIRLYRTFTSMDGRWSDTREVHVPRPNQQCDDSRCTAVVGRTVYWPCRVNTIHNVNQILALDVDAGEVTTMGLPRGSFSTVRLLLARVRGRLGMLVHESRGIAMWTLAAGTWSRQAVISNLEIARQLPMAVVPGLGVLYTLEGFGERSGVVILNMFNRGFLLRLDLGMKEEAPVVALLCTPGNLVSVAELFLHEIDLVSLLHAMKHF